MKRAHIVAAIIFNPERSQVFITQRPNGVHKGGFWEFPGGKIEQGETIEQAICRELDEEIGITVTDVHHYEYMEYDYSDKALIFDFMCVTRFNGSPYGKEGQNGKWVKIKELSNYSFPEANVLIVKRILKEFA